MKNKKRSSWKRWLSWVGLTLLLIVSLALIFNQQIKDYLVDSYKPEISQTKINNNKKKSGNFDFKDVKSLDLQMVGKARAKKSALNVIGEISIPSIKLNLPIAKGVDNYTLALAAGTMRADQKMGEGNYPLAGHHMNSHTILFSPLYWKSKVGQKIYLTDLKKIYEYKTTEKTYIAATRVDVVENTPGKNIITLVTCDATGAGRLMVRGELVKTMKYKDAPKSVQKNFAKSFNNKD
ncbi:class A sortase [Paucilactobacillus nenjiangensis]|uniref:class A sortase n=1 Tax=Paucilactobacillus nenjiangensis TaxID=1296540 RepID=UPI003BB77746